MVKKYIAIVGIAFFVFVCLVMPFVSFEDSPTGLTSLSSDSSTSAKIGKHYFSPEETNLINLRIEEGAT